MLPNCAPILSTIGMEGSSDIGQTRLNDVLPLIENNLTIQEVAEKLGISVEAACAVVVATIQHSSRHKEGPCPKEREEEKKEERPALLLEAGFKSIEDGSLWKKGGVYYGREAAVQEARRKLSEGGDDQAS